MIYRGTIGSVAEEAGGFTAALVSRKAELGRDPVPRTSPSCRAASRARLYAHRPALPTGTLGAFDPINNAATVTSAATMSDLLKVEHCAGSTGRSVDRPQGSSR